MAVVRAMAMERVVRTTCMRRAYSVLVWGVNYNYTTSRVVVAVALQGDDKDLGGGGGLERLSREGHPWFTPRLDVILTVRIVFLLVKTTGVSRS